MAIIQEVRGFTPVIGKDCFLAANAVVVGDVVIGDGCSVWFGAVLRGDVNSTTVRYGNASPLSYRLRRKSGYPLNA